jgi:hypothetical protein
MSGNPHPFATTRLAGWRITDLIAEVDRHQRSHLAQPGGRCLPSSVEATASRRVIARVLAGGAFAGLAGRFGIVEASSAKRKRKNKKKKKVCWGAAPVYCSPPADEPTAYCYPDGATCCSSAQGGGACPPRLLMLSSFAARTSGLMFSHRIPLLSRCYRQFLSAVCSELLPTHAARSARSLHAHRQSLLHGGRGRRFLPRRRDLLPTFSRVPQRHVCTSRRAMSAKRRSGAGQAGRPRAQDGAS